MTLLGTIITKPPWQEYVCNTRELGSAIIVFGFFCIQFKWTIQDLMELEIYVSVPHWLNPEVSLTISRFWNDPWSARYTEAGVIVKIASPDDCLCVWNVGGALQAGCKGGLPWPFDLVCACVSVFCFYYVLCMCVSLMPASMSVHVLSVCTSIHLL